MPLIGQHFNEVGAVVALEITAARAHTANNNAHSILPTLKPIFSAHHRTLKHKLAMSDATV